MAQLLNHRMPTISCPHVRVGGKRIGKTRVSVRAEWDSYGINQMMDFLHVTANFNKRFYKKLDNRTESPDGEEHWYLVFNAVGISRDLIYEFYWSVPCNRDLKLNKTWEEYLKNEVPLHGLVPSDSDIKDFLYPHHNQDQWQDRFRYEGFVEVSHIEEAD